MSIRIALAGNPNCGKTTIFNILTGSNQYVGNWPGVTVEKKEGKWKGEGDVVFTDLPGIYSLSPYTLEEVVARNYLIEERPDAILNIVDGSNLERNLYLTTQMLELGIPVVVAINMMDVVRKRGDEIYIDVLSKKLGCPVVEVAAIKGEGVAEAALVSIAEAKKGPRIPGHIFSGEVEHAVAHIEEAVSAIHSMPDEWQRWYAIKLFERDQRVVKYLNLDEQIVTHIESDIRHVEQHMDDDAEAIITNERYDYIVARMGSVRKRKHAGRLSTSDKIDKILTNRILAIPVFALIMWLVYTLAIGTVGNWTVAFMNDGLFGSFAESVSAGDLPAFMGNWVSVPELLDMVLLGANGEPVIAQWLYTLIMDGIVGGVGAVLGFVPQMVILFLLLSVLEDCGYMSRIAFIMDRLFRRFGLSGKSFIPMLVACGCGVPGIMASRTIEQDRDRKITIMTTGFIPCGAKMPIVGFIAGALFGGSSLIATSAYFIGVGAVVVSGVILKKTKLFAGDPAPFVMELPAYHMPVASNVLRATWERGWSFIKKAGTVILLASVVIWALNSLSFDGGFHYISSQNGGKSLLEWIGSVIAYLFVPLGFGSWQPAIATILGLVAKEEVVGVFGTLSSMAETFGETAIGMAEEGSTALATLGSEFFGGRLSAFSFLIFNLLCAPCFAAMGAIRREMNSAKWTAGAIGYMCVFAYAVSLIVYNIGTLIAHGTFTVWTAAAFLVLIVMIYLLVRKNKHTN